MKKNMIIITIEIALVCTLMCGAVIAEDYEIVERTEQSVSNDLTARVAQILSNYDSENLTAADAKSINAAFREAGIRRGPGQKEAIEASGFAPRAISSLDPPPERRAEGDSSQRRDLL